MELKTVWGKLLDIYHELGIGQKEAKEIIARAMTEITLLDARQKEEV